MPQLLAATVLAAALHLLGGCGQTGPLYLPEEAPPGADDTAGVTIHRTGKPS